MAQGQRRRRFRRRLGGGAVSLQAYRRFGNRQDRWFGRCAPLSGSEGEARGQDPGVVWWRDVWRGAGGIGGGEGGGGTGGVGGVGGAWRRGGEGGGGGERSGG